jgi:hypothetical protein
VEDVIDKQHKAFSVDHVGIADALYHLKKGLAVGAVQNADRSWCIVLSRKTRKPGENGTGARVWPEFVRFTLQNDGLLDRALELGLNAKHDEEISELKIVDLTRSVISQNSEFFRNLLDEAIRESTEGQEN